MKWQPIATAPKNGETWVLVFEPRLDAPFGGAWPAHVAEPQYQTSPEGILVTGNGRDGEHYGWFPTHWMPLPEPPLLEEHLP